MSLADARRVHFVGIGGAGMSAIAKVLLERGFTVTGSDFKRSRAAMMLEAMGAPVNVGHDATLVDGADLVVISTAIPERNPELVRARETGIEVMSRGGALAAILNDFESIVVAGTHGKTTTTSMIVSVLHAADRDPTYLVGGGLNDAGTNARLGRDRSAVVESDESDGSFLLLEPHIAVVTNVEADHLDHWGSFAAIKEGFKSFLDAVASGGSAVLPAGHFLDDYEPAPGVELCTFGDGGDVEASDVVASSAGMNFGLCHRGERAPVALRVPGRHNVANALAAAGACLRAGLGLDAVARGLGDYRGVERRFQIRGNAAGVTVIDDYAHHPTEVAATLEAARGGAWRRVVAVFQPHRYSRTQALFAEFGGAFGDADRIVVTDVYGAGEQPVPGVSGKLVADAVCAKLPGRAVAYLPHHDELIGYLRGSARPGDAVLTLGAGDIGGLGEELLAELDGNGRGSDERAPRIP
jgi:UDP-N-acetylmuramate--alanine ligase